MSSMKAAKGKIDSVYKESKQHFNQHIADPWSTHKKKISTVWLIGMYLSFTVLNSINTPFVFSTCMDYMQYIYIQ